MTSAPAARPRVLFVYADRVAAEMGGTGIRATELARALAEHADVAIAATDTDGTDLGMPVSVFSPHAPAELGRLASAADVVVAQPQWPLAMRSLRRSGAQLIFDLYDPEVFGTLEHFQDRSRALRRTMAAFAGDRIDQALRLGDRIMCGSERQRDLWLGTMLSLGRVEGGIYGHDHTLRSLIDTVPFGVPAQPAAPGPEAGPRELLGIGREEKLVLWNGGIWSWLDADCAIRAVAELRSSSPGTRLVFMGASSSPAARQPAERARGLARELGELGSGVLFHDDWVPYGQRANWLLEADCAISAHPDHLEARYAHRTRLLDCLWARLPVACSAGDELADLVELDDLGATAPPGDAGALARALERVLSNGRDHYRDRLARAAEERSWSRVSAPLVSWIREEPPPRPRHGPRPAGERVRSAAYLAAAWPAAAVGLRPPRLS